MHSANSLLSSFQVHQNQEDYLNQQVIYSLTVISKDDLSGLLLDVKENLMQNMLRQYFL